MTRLDLTTLPWANTRILCCAVADATERYAARSGKTFNGSSWRPGSYKEHEHDEILQLCACLRCVTPRGTRRLDTTVARDLRRLDVAFQNKQARFEVLRHATRIGLGCWDSSAVPTSVPSPIIAFQRAVDQVGLINVWDVFEPWRVCDAFNVFDVEQIQPEARAAFDAIWLATEYKAAYAYAATWRATMAA